MILVTGATGFLGKRLCRRLDLLGIKYTGVSSDPGPNLLDRAATVKFFKRTRPRYVLNCAAFVGGIRYGYKYPADLFSRNLLMGLNLLEAAVETGVARLVNPISNCAYPGASSVFKESEFWDGPLHESVFAYGGSRKALCLASSAYSKQYGLDVLNLIFPNMYGPEDHFDEERSHALGALIAKTFRAKQRGDSYITIWGSGAPVREWLHVDDASEAMLRAIDVEASLTPVNIGTGKGITVAALAALIVAEVGYNGTLSFDRTQPDGAQHKVMDNTLGMKLFSWQPSRSLALGIAQTVQWYREFGEI